MRPDPQYGVQLSVADIPLELPISPIYGVTSENRYIPIQVDNDGKLSIGNVTITGPVTVNDVVIKGVDPDNGNTSEDFGVYNLGLGNGYAMRSTLFDGGNHLKIESDGSADVYITGTGIAIPVTIDHALDSVAIYGTDGSTDRFIKTDASGNLQVGIVGGTLAVTQSTSPWVISGTVTANAGTGTFLVDGSAHTQPVSGTFFQATQPISGTVTANIGTTNGLALDATLTNGTQHTLVDNFPASQVVTLASTTVTGTVAVTQSTSPWVVSGSITTSPNVNVHDGIGTSISSTGSSLNVDVTNTVPVTGTFFQAIQPISIDQTGDNNDVDVINGAGTAAVNIQDGGNSITVDGTITANQGTSPWIVSGTVTANIGTSGALALDATVAKLTLAQGSTTASETGPLIQGAVTTSAPTYTTGQTNPLSLDTSGNLRTVGTATISGTVTVIGNKTNNNATPGTTNIGVLPALANAVAPTWTEGDQVLLSEDLSGRLRIDNTSWLGSTAPTVGQKTSANSIPVVIASDQSDVGINIDKYGGTSTTLGQKVMTSSVPVTLASDQPTLNVSITGSTDLASGKVFYAAIDNYNLATAGSNNPIFLFKNPIGSGKTMNIFSVTGNCKVSNVQVTFLMFKNPTVTANGSAFTPVNANFGSGNTSVVNVFTGSTVSSSGTLVVIDQVGQNANSSNMIITEQIAVPPGQTVLISGDPFSNNRAIIETVGWSEN